MKNTGTTMNINEQTKDINEKQWKSMKNNEHLWKHNEKTIKTIFIDFHDF